MGLFKSLFGGNSTPETEKDKNDKKNFEILKYDGIRAQRIGKLAYAIKCFEEAVAINDEPETLGILATVYTQSNRLDDARITLDRLAEKEPEEVSTFLSLAGICYMQEDYEGMNDACQKALALDSKDPLTYYLSAKAAVGMKNEINAIAMLTKAIVMKEDYTEAYQLRAEVLWGMKQAKDAAEDIQKLLSLNPEDEQALLLKGEILAATGEEAQAQECFNQVLSLNPFNEKAYLLLGELHLTKKDLDKAIEVYDEAIEINPNFAKAYHERGRVKLLRGDKEGSIEDMKKALELTPDSEANISGQYNNYENMTKNVPF
ncbi:tetratricopeptide repeat protein [Phocaeicola sp.]